MIKIQRFSESLEGACSESTSYAQFANLEWVIHVISIFKKRPQAIRGDQAETAPPPPLNTCIQCPLTQILDASLLYMLNARTFSVEDFRDLFNSVQHWSS